MCVIKASLQATGLGPPSRMPLRIAHLEDGGWVGEALCTDSSLLVIEGFPWEQKFPHTSGSACTGVGVQGPPAASEQALSGKLLGRLAVLGELSSTASG